MPLSFDKGCGAVFVKYAADYEKKAKAEYIWCNARTSASEFYQKRGLETISEEIKIPGIGSHYIMILNLNIE